MPEKKSGHPVFGHFVSKLCVFVPFSNRVILERAALYELVFMSKKSTFKGFSPTFKLHMKSIQFGDI